jgi:hypothetical protein
MIVLQNSEQNSNKTSEVKALLITDYATMSVDYARDSTDVQQLQSLLEPHIMCAQITKMSVVMKKQSGQLKTADNMKYRII